MSDHENVRRATALANMVLARDFPTLELYDHQRTALINRLSFGWKTGDFSTLLAGDVGTGKTPFYLVYLRCVREWYKLQGHAESLRPSLAIVPAQIKLQWREEALAWSNLSPLAYLVVDGDQASRAAQLTILPKALEGKLELLIINYALARRKIEQQLLQALPILGLVVDEAHRIKTRTSQQTRATKSIDCEFMVCGSGTLMTKSPADLWSILHAMYPGEAFYRKAYVEMPKPTDGCPQHGYWRDHYTKAKTGCQRCPRYEECDKHTPHDEGLPLRYRRSSPMWGNYETFTGNYCRQETVHVGHGRYVRKITGAKNLPDLRRRLQPHTVRWRKAEVLQLPPLYFRHVLLDFKQGGDQSIMYQNLKAGFIDQLSGDGYWSPVSLRSRMAQLLYLRRALSLSPRAFHKHIQKRANGDVPPWVQQSLFKKGADNAKLDWLERFLEENVYTGDAQALVFSNWSTTTREIRDRLKKHADVTGYITGERTKVQNQQARDAFNEGRLDVMIGSPAISEGINLQGSGRRAAYVVICDLSWVPGPILQTIGRLYRAKQQSDVEVVFLGVRDTLDQRMLSRVQKLQQYFVEILDGKRDAGSITLFEIETARQLIDML